LDGNAIQGRILTSCVKIGRKSFFRPNKEANFKVALKKEFSHKIQGSLGVAQLRKTTRDRPPQSGIDKELSKRREFLCENK
jgi:hypothetical protein